jgi:RNA polymerase sigma-70 factor (ECF subfamily)
MIATEDQWQQLHDGVSAFVRRRINDPADAEDVVQSLFLRLHKGLPGLRDERRLYGWIYGAARNAITDHYRAKGRAKESPAGLASDFAETVNGDATSLPPIPGGDDKNAAAELARCLEPLMSGLPANDQEALRLVELQGVTQTEAAGRLGVSISGMKSRVQRARSRLRDVIEECCRIELSRRGELVSASPRPGVKGPCSPCRPH